MRTRSLLPSGHRTFPSARWKLMARSQPQPLPGRVRWRPSHPARTASVPGIRAGPGARVDLLHQPRTPRFNADNRPLRGSARRAARPVAPPGRLDLVGGSRRPVRRPRQIAGRANRSRSSSDPAVPTPCQRRSAHMDIKTCQTARCDRHRPWSPPQCATYKADVGGSSPSAPTSVMCQDIGNVRTPGGFGCCHLRRGW